MAAITCNYRVFSLIIFSKHVVKTKPFFDPQCRERNRINSSDCGGIQMEFILRSRINSFCPSIPWFFYVFYAISAVEISYRQPQVNFFSVGPVYMLCLLISTLQVDPTKWQRNTHGYLASSSVADLERRLMEFNPPPLGPDFSYFCNIPLVQDCSCVML